MYRLRPILAYALLSSLVLSTGLIVPAAAAPARAGHGRAAVPVPSFAPAPCPFKLGTGLVQGAGRDVRCGYLTVPERYTAPAGHTIRLPVAIFKGSDDVAHPDPIVSLQGGPGGAWVDQIGPTITQKNARDMVGKRDLILVDQRGTGLSRPSLNCTELTDLKYRTIEQPLTTAQSNAQAIVATRACRNRLVAQGIDLAAYTTSADAADVNSLRVALGYQMINLYGVSYGTELGAVVVRDFPGHLRSVVLDSVDPVQGNQQVDGAGANAHVLRAFFDGCAAAPMCRATFPTIEPEFNALVAKLNATPVTISTQNPYTNKTYRVPLNGDSLAGVIIGSFYLTQVIPALPAAIDLASKGSYRLVTLLYNATQFDDTISLGMFNSVECGEDAGPYSPPGAFNRAALAFAPPLRQSERLQGDFFLKSCAIWGVPPVPSSFKRPVVSSVPTLLLAGQYDPVTPLSDARLVAKGFSHSYTIEFPGDGHAQNFSGPCPASIVMSFWDHPMVKPNTACVATLSGSKFLIPGQGN